MGKTCLYSISYLDGEDASGTSRLERQIRYVNYYRPLKKHLGFDNFVFWDNGSSIDNRILFEEYLEAKDDFYTSEIHLERKGPVDYEFCWKALHFIKQLISQGYEKIISIDTDGFVLSKALASYIKNNNNGWYAFWNKYYRFPTAELHVLNKNSFDFFRGFTSIPYHFLNGNIEMERALPFEYISMNFNVERYGEYQTKQHSSWDFCGQVNSKIELEFEK